MALGFKTIQDKLILIGKASLYSQSTTTPSTVNTVVDIILGDHFVASHYAVFRANAYLRDDGKKKMQDSDTLYPNPEIKCRRSLLWDQSSPHTMKSVILAPYSHQRFIVVANHQINHSCLSTLR